jgi:hypothetical protein
MYWDFVTNQQKKWNDWCDKVTFWGDKRMK